MSAIDKCLQWLDKPAYETMSLLAKDAQVELVALRAENERLKHQTKELEHNLNCKVRELTRIADARDTSREIAGELGKDLRDAVMFIEAQYIDWDKYRHGNADYDSNYKPEFPPIVKRFNTTLARWTEIEKGKG